MFKNRFLFVIIIFLFSGKPVSFSDTEIEILYLCDVDGNFEFDQDGRSGIATLSEYKRLERERLEAENGQVFLFSSGNFFGKTKETGTVLKLLSLVPFDGIFLSDEDFSVLEKRPSVENMGSILLTSKKNSKGFESEKRIQFRNLNLVFSETFPDSSSNGKINAKLIFSVANDIPENIRTAPLHPPEIYFIRKSKLSSYFYRQGVYFAYCPDRSGEIGKLNLYFRDGRLIRNRQEFVYMNITDQGRSWIDPNRNIVHELK